jgi:hypothetical protein
MEGLPSIGAHGFQNVAFIVHRAECASDLPQHERHGGHGNGSSERGVRHWRLQLEAGRISGASAIPCSSKTGVTISGSRQSESNFWHIAGCARATIRIAPYIRTLVRHGGPIHGLIDPGIHGVQALVVVPTLPVFTAMTASNRSFSTSSC